VAGALMYEKISEGIFLEVGGTSTDISAIKNGKVMVSYAEVGGHKTYVSSLDVRTVAIAGGSMIRLSKTDIIDVGPRSAHIAGLPYMAYANPDEVSDDLEVCLFKPKEGDFADYVSIRDKKNGKKYALTLSCAANASGYVKEGNYSSGNAELALKGFQIVSDAIGKSVEDILASVHSKAAAKNRRVVKQLILDYNLDPSQLVLVGGGGGAAAVVPYLGIDMGMKHKISKNAEVISPIGVALALVRDVVERTISNPTQADILSVRREAEQAALKSGAAQATIEIVVEIDTKSNIVRATATGATELRTKNRFVAIKTEDEIQQIAADTLSLPPNSVQIEARTDGFYVCAAQTVIPSFFGLFRKITPVSWIIDREGVIRLHKKNARAFTVLAQDCAEVLEEKIRQYTDYNDGGEIIPESCVLINSRIADFSNLKVSEQIISLLKIELSGVSDDEEVVIFLSGDRVKQ
jgi:N-methylhydantoinase A/oxoprolinase/acetone carboxylase beta subunit